MVFSWKKKRIYLTLAILITAISLGIAYINLVSAPPSGPPAPHGGFSFRVEIDGIVTSSFSEVEGLNVTVDVIESREGTEEIKPRTSPGVAHFGPLILRRGITTPSRELWEWMKLTLEGTVDKRDMSVILMSPSREDLMRIKPA
jgi:phage tail-like protein